MLREREGSERGARIACERAERVGEQWGTDRPSEREGSKRGASVPARGKSKRGAREWGARGEQEGEREVEKTVFKVGSKWERYQRVEVPTRTADRSAPIEL